MCRLDDLDTPGGHRVAITRHYHATQFDVAPGGFQGSRHGGGCLARSDYDASAARAIRKMLGDHLARIRTCYCCVEHAAQHPAG
ncbi:hypothetical protein PMI09_05327 [Rhizobium sp. CF122]|nr:hypothetical protein PMI09_05327 [Rhizobium sp. CF122]